MSKGKPDSSKSKPGKKKVTLRKETLRDLKARKTQQVKGGAACSWSNGCT